LADFWDPLAALIFIAWFLFNIILYVSPLGYTVKGTLLRNGERLSYKINGLHAFIIAHILFVVGYCYFKLNVSYVYHHYLAFAASSIFFSFFLSLYLYLKSFHEGSLLALGGNSGSFFYDFFMGRELNPRIGIFDWKVFCELRPGLIGWTIINYCMLAAQYEKIGAVSPQMILICLFQSWYVLDALVCEEAILTTMDVIQDGFGFMLMFGDIAWVPFTYTLQARYLVDHSTEMSGSLLLFIFCLNAFGYYIFRGANHQKDQYRRDPSHPSVQNLKTIPTKRGTKLLVSGWWGYCRHPNYVGDLFMGLSWCLICGFNHVIPYFYIIYFVVLLIHRQLRDEESCSKKYGKDWDRYCSIVKWRLIPHLY
jgi:protein-S-isoprenylcysteine O-methyltransferase Ste14